MHRQCLCSALHLPHTGEVHSRRRDVRCRLRAVLPTPLPCEHRNWRVDVHGVPYFRAQPRDGQVSTLPVSMAVLPAKYCRRHGSRLATYRKKCHPMSSGNVKFVEHVKIRKPTYFQDYFAQMDDFLFFGRVRNPAHSERQQLSHRFKMPNRQEVPFISSLGGSLESVSASAPQIVPIFPALR